MTRTRFWRVLALFVVLSLGLTWPLLPHLLTHVPGDGIDDPALAWNLWWARHSWVDRAGENGLVHSPFDGDGMFYPVGINLAFYTLTLLNGALSIPLQLAGSVILASNLLLLGSFVLGGLGAYLLALDVLVGMERPGTEADRRRLRAAALPAGLLYAFASAKLFYAALGQFNIASSQWLPFVALYLVRAARGPWCWRYGVLLGLFLCFQTWAELTYGSFAVLLIALTVGVIVAAAVAGRIIPLFRAQTRLAAPARRLLTAAVMAAGLFLLGLAPYLRAMAPDLAAEGDFLVEGSGFAEIFSADLVGFFFPTQLHPLFGGVIRRIADDSAIRPDRSQFQVNKGQHLFWGYTAITLAAVGLWRRRHRRELWLVAGLTVFFGLAALGPRLRWNGYDTGIPGLFPLLLKIPFFQANRYPSRYSVLILLGLAVLVAVGAAVVLGRVRADRRGAVTALLAGLLLFEHLSVPLPLSDLRLPPAYRAVLADSRPGALLDVPLGWRNGFNVFGKSDVIIMFIQWYQTYHGRPLLSGNTSRNPEHKFQYFLENPVLGVLAALQDDRPVAAADLERAQALAPDLLRFLNVHTVLLHRNRVPATFPAQLEQLLPLTRVEEAGDIVRYEVHLPPERATAAIAAADPELRGYLAQGWGVPVEADGRSLVWATRPQAHLLLPGLSRAATFRLRLYVPGEQSLRLVLDGRAIARHVLAPGEHEVPVPVPAAADGFPHRLVLVAERVFDPAALRRGGRVVGATGVASPVHLTVRSAGKDIGDFGHVFVNGVENSPNRRGYNLVAIAPTDGAVLAVAVFDTHDPFVTGPSAAMAAWIEALPDGVIVAGAVRDAAALNLGEDAVQALRRLGVVGDIRGHLRRAHAFVGVKGAAPGTAAEVISDLWPATVAVGDGLMESRPTLALLGLAWESDDRP